ncbi:helix-turn-helix domain-containing protein [Levilactobacillus bambusae]|uniref:Mga helix-turn-helix domain-containing protein n=1 Tax=Levilactobacillus bambusae TaxID=2024736 RepID=A0A2V1MZM6_9LACO|nr:helix-turn-helix domain-containing protein [Levilactobacillus bambusae]PWG00272.1 hypothetical protein DCM90_04900 [Levilactobacillus bambusae]
MNLFDILEKNDQIQVHIIHELLDQESEIAEKTLMERQKITRFLFNTNLSQLIQRLSELDIGIQIVESRRGRTKYLALKCQADADIAQLYYSYLKESPNYRLIHDVFFQPNYTMDFLTRDLLISEPVVYRRLTCINQRLREFKIQITGTNIEGTSLQVCYFYYEFYWNSVPVEELERQLTKATVWQLVHQVEAAINVQLAHSEQLRLYLWLAVINHYPIEQPNQSLSDSILEELQDQPIINRLVARGFGRTQALFCYLFLTTQLVLTPSAQTDQLLMPSPLKKVRQTMQTVLAVGQEQYELTLDRLESTLIRNWMQTLNQLNTRFYLFSGMVFFYKRNYYQPPLTLPLSIADKRLVAHILAATQDQLGVRLTADQADNLSSIIQFCIESIKRFSPLTLKVGIYSAANYLAAQSLLTSLKDFSHLGKTVQWEVAKPDQRYDLLVTDTRAALADFHYREGYLLSGAPNLKRDARAITRLIDQGIKEVHERRPPQIEMKDLHLE